MPENRGYLPEGLSAPPLYTLEMLRRAVSDGTVLEGTVQRCDGDLNLYLQLGSTFAKIPREEVTAPWISGADREIAVLSRVGKQVCLRWNPSPPTRKARRRPCSPAGRSRNRLWRKCAAV